MDDHLDETRACSIELACANIESTKKTDKRTTNTTRHQLCLLPYCSARRTPFNCVLHFISSSRYPSFICPISILLPVDTLL